MGTPPDIHVAPAAAVPPARPPLNPDQSAAITLIQAWLSDRGAIGSIGHAPYFVLEGFAGTGKTFAVQELIARTKARMVFTAPTNKATKVLRDTLTRPDYKPECRTIFSLLGLKLEASGEIKELSAPEDPLDLTEFACVVVDEGSMISATLMKHIDATAFGQGVKFLFLGDPAQLPPVKEQRSTLWAMAEELPPESKSKLTKVMRHDNQILRLVTSIRGQVDSFVPRIAMASDNSDGEGVWKLTAAGFHGALRRAAHQGMFNPAEGMPVAKAIAWRNATVDRYNTYIRQHVFGDIHDPETLSLSPWVEDDRVLFTGPAKDLDDETIATTDDEGRVVRVESGYHPRETEFKVHIVTIALDSNRLVVARVLHPDSFRAFEKRVAELSTAARATPRLWGKFWDFKDCFHGLRHAYAITTHRSQGSTYHTAFVDTQDILLNQNRQEAYRCLYVACSRPKARLLLL